MIRDKLFSTSPYDSFDPEPYPDDIHGWGSDHPLLVEAIRSLQPHTVCEVGSWKGRSAINMARIVRQLALDTEIVCVDTWLGSPEHWLTRDNPNFYDSLRIRNGFPQLYFTFLANVVRHGFSDIITPFPTTSENAAAIFQRLKIRFDLIYIDAAHEYDPVIRDLTSYYNLLGETGLLIGDDYAIFSGVTQAANEFAMKQGVPFFATKGKFMIPKGKIKINLGIEPMK